MKEELFYQLLTLHGVDLSPEAKTVINSSYKKKDRINYSEALTVIAIDQETAALNVQSWVVRRQQDRTDNKSDARSTISRAKSLVS